MAVPSTRQALLQHLYQVIHCLVPARYAPNITGMFTECDEQQLLHLLANQNVLEDRVKQALEVLEIGCSPNHPTRVQSQLAGPQPGSADEQSQCSDVQCLRGEVSSGPASMLPVPKAPVGDPKEDNLELAERLFHSVTQLETELCAQLTGMLLELQPSVLNHLLCCPSDLKKAVEKARMEYLKAKHLTNSSTAYPSTHSDCRGQSMGKAEVGEKLYGHITKLYPKNAAKLTGMLLELGVGRLHLLLTTADGPLKMGEETELGTRLAEARKALEISGQWLQEEK